jgi:ribonuclease T1
MNGGAGTRNQARRAWRGPWILLVLALSLLSAVACRPAASTTMSSASAPEVGATVSPDLASATAHRHSKLPTVTVAKLPKQARATIALIDAGGPFPFDRDGITFQNRESLLPRQPKGYYREYTVVTPGSSDRGARRIIAGKGGELYYTDDHYDSFREVLR